MKKALIAMMVLTVLASSATLLGCGGGGDGKAEDPGSPESVARTFWEAAMTGDADTSWELLSEDLKAGLKSKEDWAGSGVTNTLGGNTIEVGKAKITGDTAEVTIRIMSGDTEITDSDVLLVKEDGDWKVKLP